MLGYVNLKLLTNYCYAFFDISISRNSSQGRKEMSEHSLVNLLKPYLLLGFWVKGCSV